MASNGWKKLPALQSKWPVRNPVSIGESIWISTNHYDGERGLVEFHCPSGRIKHIAKYPHGFKPDDHSVTGSTENGIVLVDGFDGKLITFNTESRKYGEIVSIPKLGYGTSCLMIQGNVHIIHGAFNSSNLYLIYSMDTGKVTKFMDNLKLPPMRGVAFTKRDDGSEFYKFGGCVESFNSVDSFHVGTLQNGDSSKPIIWRRSPSNKLKKDAYQFGFISSGTFVIALGGESGSRGWQCFDIYTLDTRRKSGWIQRAIECPVSGPCIAVLDNLYTVHLFASCAKSEGHYSIAMKALVPEFVVPPMTQRVVMRKKQIQQHRDDEKGCDQVVSSANSKDEIETLKLALIRSLEDEVERLKKTNSKMMKKEKKKRMENGRTKLMNESLQNEVKMLEKTNADLIQKQKGLELDVMRLNAENKQLIDQVTGYQDEQRDFQRTIAELRDKVKELEIRALDSSKFMEWDCNQILMWIMGLEGGRFRKYEAVLKDSLSVDEVVGEDLLDVTPLVLKAWGVKDRKDSKGLNKHIQELVARNRSNQTAMIIPKHNEGAPTAYM